MPYTPSRSPASIGSYGSSSGWSGTTATSFPTLPAEPPLSRIFSEEPLGHPCCGTPTLHRPSTTSRVPLLRGPVLHSPDFSCPFIVQADASATGLGAILSQESTDGEHFVAYLSQKLQPVECHYAIIEREALAIKWAVTSWRYYLTANPFILVTDHAPLLWMHHLKDAKILRWYLALLPFSFTTRHRRGPCTPMPMTSPGCPLSTTMDH